MALIDKHPELVRYISEREWFMFLREQTAAMSDIPEMMLQVHTLDSLLEMYSRILHAVEYDEPFVASYYCLAPELYTAMDLPYYMVMQTPFLASSVPYILEDIDAAEEMGLGSDQWDCGPVGWSHMAGDSSWLSIDCCLGCRGSVCGGHQPASHFAAVSQQRRAGLRSSYPSVDEKEAH